MLLFAALAPLAGAEPLACFSERTSSTLNMCERAFYAYSSASTPETCASQCVADARCIFFGLEPQGDPSRRCRLSSTCHQPNVSLSGWEGFVRTSATGSCTPSPSPPPAPAVPGVWERVFLHDGAAKGAVCIDGSPGAYYIRTHTAAGAPVDPSSVPARARRHSSPPTD